MSKEARKPYPAPAFNVFSIEELFKAANRNPELRSAFTFGKHWDARALRAKARYAKRKSRRASLRKREKV